MKFVISRNDLYELVTRVQNIIPQKVPVPILANFLLEADGSHLVLTATDFTIDVRVRGAAKIIEPGKITVPAKLFSQLLRELTSSHVEISSKNGDTIEIVADASSFKMRGLPHSSFPQFSDFSSAMQLRMKQGELKELFYRTSFAVAKDDSRYSLSGVYVSASQNEVLFIGTDGKRLARAKHSVETDPSLHYECIVPPKAVEEMKKNLMHEDEVVTLYFMGDKIALETSDAIIVTKLLSGDYPDVEAVIPKQSNHFVMLHREELMSLLRQISIFTKDTTQSVRFSLENGILKVAVNTADIGEGNVSMPVNYTGELVEIAFNPAAFLDVLRHSRQEIVMMGFTDRFNPCILFDGEHQIGGEYPTPLFVLMPMRLSSDEMVTVI